MPRIGRFVEEGGRLVGCQGLEERESNGYGIPLEGDEIFWN
jgi:hypothetical protein